MGKREYSIISEQCTWENEKGFVNEEGELFERIVESFLRDNEAVPCGGISVIPITGGKLLLVSQACYYS